MESFIQQRKIQNDQYTLKNYQKYREAGKNDPWQEEKSTDRNRPRNDRDDWISKKEIDLSAIIYTIKCSNVKRKHKYDEQGTERYKKDSTGTLRKCVISAKKNTLDNTVVD